MSRHTARSGPRTLTALGILALLASLLAIASPVAAGAGVGTIAIFKDMCQDIGQQDTCKGRDTSLADYHIDFTVDPVTETGAPREGQSELIVVTLGDNDGDGGNLGNGSQGRKLGGELALGYYLVCEIPVAYLEGEDDVELDVLPRPDAGGGGSTGGSQAQFDETCILVNLGTGTNEVKFLDLASDRGSLLVLKTNNANPAAPLAGAVFALTDNEGNPVGDSETTGAGGTVCFDDLALFTEYTVTETQAPPGHTLASPASQPVTVTESGPCDDRSSEPDATFVNPLIVVTPPTPTLVVDKVGSTDAITISGPANALVADPSVVTWTLSYTLTNGPVTGAVITDQIPTGFTFLDALNGGTFASGTVAWDLGTLTTSGSVSFRTTVNPATISRTGPTVNTAIIDSTETPPDTGQDSVTVTVIAPPLGGNPTPTPTPAPAAPIGGSVPNTAMELPAAGLSVAVLALFALLGLVYMAHRNVVVSRNRR